jgi:hypothetical protein
LFENQNINHFSLYEKSKNMNPTTTLMNIWKTWLDLLKKEKYLMLVNGTNYCFERCRIVRVKKRFVLVGHWYFHSFPYFMCVCTILKVLTFFLCSVDFLNLYIQNNLLRILLIVIKQTIMDPTYIIRTTLMSYFDFSFTGTKQCTFPFRPALL